MLWDIATGCALCSCSYSNMFHRISPFEDSRKKEMMYLEGLLYYDFGCGSITKLNLLQSIVGSICLGYDTKLPYYCLYANRGNSLLKGALVSRKKLNALVNIELNLD